MFSKIGGCRFSGFAGIQSTTEDSVVLRNLNPYAVSPKTLRKLYAISLEPANPKPHRSKARRPKVIRKTHLSCHFCNPGPETSMPHATEGIPAMQSRARILNPLTGSFTSSSRGTSAYDSKTLNRNLNPTS